MKRNKKINSTPKSAGSYDQLGSNSDFYAGGSLSEQPLYSQQHHSSAKGVHVTGRHQAAKGKREEGGDPREKMAMLAILKLSIIFILLLIAFFMLWKGISIYEESVFIKTQNEQDLSPVMKEMVLVDDFDVESQESRELFAERINIWKQATRLVRSADGLLNRNNYDQAIARCQEALKISPWHVGALERLAQLYYDRGMYVESINSYVRLLSIDPSRVDLQEKVIQALDANSDVNAVAYMAAWYLEENPHNANVQRHLANSLFIKEEFADAANAYERVLKDFPGDAEALEQQAKAYMYLEEYDAALKTLEKLQLINYRDSNTYRSIAVCHAQLEQGLETVQTLGKAAHLFGQNIVMGWIQDPRLDPVREDRSFQAFADRIGGEEFRKWLEKVAKTMENNEREDIEPQLTLPKDGILKEEILPSEK
ncbi:tetratricopeptide repeat protein [Pontiellaceae bacterium B1224]|nr:tetratricopeptide repeat protein [Pontiellaceae bacterium B1224]